MVDQAQRRRWERFATTNPEFYIWTDVAHGDDFAASGRRDAERIFALCEPHLARRQVVLEIGCGMGRLLMPMAERFGRAVGVDISATMLAHLRERCAAAGVENVTGALPEDAWDGDAVLDLAYSHIVFQHIGKWDDIADYFRRVASALAPGGVFYAQFDTRSRTVPYRVKTALPDFLLPTTMRRGVRRIRRTVAEIERLATSCGLRTVSQSGEGSTDTAFVFVR
jgi:cyclopropane fatty-acyl-phospholipid synthase-like methyltransferase